MSVVRDNLMNQRGYSPYCGNENCPSSPRTVFVRDQFVCKQCGWKSRFPAEFIAKYKAKWRINDVYPSHP